MQDLSVFKNSSYNFFIVSFAAILAVQILAHCRYTADVPNADYKFLVLCRGDYILLDSLLINCIVFCFYFMPHSRFLLNC